MGGEVDWRRGGIFLIQSNLSDKTRKKNKTKDKTGDKT